MEEALLLQQSEIEALNTRLHQAVFESSHRIKNSLQVLAAMVDLQLMEDTDQIPAEEFRRLSSQIRTLSAVNDMITLGTKVDATNTLISSQSALGTLLKMLRETSGGSTLQYHIDDTMLSIKIITSLSLLINELVSNAIKHGNGQIEVRFTVQEQSAFLHVLDNGRGFPVDFDPRTAAHTGLELIETLTRSDLRGEVFYRNRPEGGGEVCLVFPCSRE